MKFEWVFLLLFCLFIGVNKLHTCNIKKNLTKYQYVNVFISVEHLNDELFHTITYSVQKCTEDDLLKQSVKMRLQTKAEEHCLIVRTMNNRCFFCIGYVCEPRSPPSATDVCETQLSCYCRHQWAYWALHNTGLCLQTPQYTDCFNGAPCAWLTKYK